MAWASTAARWVGWASLVLGAYASPTCAIRALCEQDTALTLPGSNASFVLLDVRNRSADVVCVGRHGGFATSCVEHGHVDFVVMQLPYSFEGLLELDILHVNSSTNERHSHRKLFFPLRLEGIPSFYSRVTITTPSFGTLATTAIRWDVQRCGEEFDSLHFVIQEIGQFSLTPNTGFIQGMMEGASEPGSWFVELTPIRSPHGSAEVEASFKSFGYAEIVLPDNQMQEERLFRNHSSVAKPPSVVDGDAWERSVRKHFSDVAFPVAEDPNYQIDVCIWTSNGIDGQKRIWLQQAEFLDHSTFAFKWIVGVRGGSMEQETRNVKSGTLAEALLEQPDVVVVDSPFNRMTIPNELFDETPADGGAPLPLALVGGNDDVLYEYLYAQMVKANGSIADVSPLWCRWILEVVRETLLTNQCDLIVYGNNRGFGPDIIITEVARWLGIPSVTELLNLFLHPDVVPDVVVAPSLYALSHESIQSTLLTSPRHPAGGVISPAVDFNHFHPHVSAHSPSKCPDVDGPHSELLCVTIGFVARASVGKNPGLFLQAARLILDEYPFARFIVLGTGPILGKLQELAARLSLTPFVDFRGFVPFHKLPQHLKDIHIVVNPSLRSWSETFCIANIEAMAMEIPVVTFAVGGIGEYIRLPAGSAQSNQSWVVGDNAMIVNSASVEALAAATLYLVKHPQEMRRMGVAARQSLLQHFSLRRQMDQYSHIYRVIHSSTRIPKTLRP